MDDIARARTKVNFFYSPKILSRVTKLWKTKFLKVTSF